LVTPVCPNCGNDDSIIEWGTVSVPYGMSGIELNEDGTVGEVIADDALDPVWDSYTFESYGCRACGADNLTLDSLLEIERDHPHKVIQGGRVIGRYATVEEAEAFFLSVPENARAGMWVSTPEDEFTV
jgi:hypothetical protein